MLDAHRLEDDDDEDQSEEEVEKPNKVGTNIKAGTCNKRSMIVLIVTLTNIFANLCESAIKRLCFIVLQLSAKC